MTVEPVDLRSFDRLVILADESANWKIGGLRQLDRLALAGNEFAENNHFRIAIIVLWNTEIPPERRWLPAHRRLTNCTIAFGNEQSGETTGAFVLSTHLLVTRRGLAEFLPLAGSAEALSANEHPAGSGRDWRWISNASEISAGERWLLRSTGKSYDGIVSRYLNRPVSRFVSKFILDFPVTPNQWTLLILSLPVTACIFLSRGTYAGFLIGAAFYQLHSILDGCDGEIARIKYLDSKNGPGIDALGDLIGLLLFVAGLTAGVSHAAGVSTRWLFLVEGVVTILFIAGRLGPHTRELLARGMDAVLFSEHDDHLRRSGDHYFGRTLTSFAIAMTGRDVVYLFFLILALLGLGPWILHILFAYSLGAVLLVLKGRAMRSPGQVGPVLP